MIEIPETKSAEALAGTAEYGANLWSYSSLLNFYIYICGVGACLRNAYAT